MSNGTHKSGSEGGITPPDGPVTPEATARSIRRLRTFWRRADEIGERLERLVVEGGFDSRTVAVMEEAAEHFEDNDDIGAGTALMLRRFIATIRKGA